MSGPVAGMNAGSDGNKDAVLTSILVSEIASEPCRASGTQCTAKVFNGNPQQAGLPRSGLCCLSVLDRLIVAVPHF